MHPVHITYLGHSLWTPGHPVQLRHSHPSNGSPRISPQSSLASSEGSLLGSTYSPDAPFCSTPPTNRSLSAEKSSDDKRQWCGGISGYKCNHFIEPRNKFKATATIIRNIYVKVWESLCHKTKLWVKMSWNYLLGRLLRNREHHLRGVIKESLAYHCCNKFPCLETCYSEWNRAQLSYGNGFLSCHIWNILEDRPMVIPL